MKRYLFTFLFSSLLIGSVHAQLDTNNNGMSDIWERHFNDGELFPPGILAEGDEDGDGQSNLDESLAGTDPFEFSIPDGYFKADVRHVPETWYQGLNDPEPILENPEAYEISWYGVAGKQYILQGSTDLQNWIDITTRNGYGYLITEACFPQDENDEPFPRFFWRVKVEDIIAEDGLLTQYERELLGMVGDWDENFPGISPVWLATYFGKEILANGLYSINPNDDADGDGLTNLEEGMQGTDPNVADPPGSNSGKAQWVAAVGDSIPGDPIERTRTFTLEPGQGALLVTAIASTEFDTYTDPEGALLWNDKLSWKISYPGETGQKKTVDVNDRHSHWLQDRQAGTSVPGLPNPAHIEEVKTIFNDGSSNMNIDVTVSAENIEDGAYPSTIAVGFIPIETAPDVLAVNSNFDEGRIDPTTGYPIPDCDDIPGVDPKTGAGNTLMALEAVRAHLDGTYTQYQRVTNNLHEGWFGVNPKSLTRSFWDGANVTIRKINQIDDDTGQPESGQIRFYAKWGEDSFQYRGIPTYDLATLTPVNLVTGGINAAPSESVYGSNSVIPVGAKFYIEGVRPGKITLEWRYQKGAIDVKYEQTFLVETHWSPAQWKADLAYKIRLDTDNDPSGQINVLVDPRGAPRDYWVRVERMSEYYDYYQENYLVDDSFQWCGLARLAGSQVISGVSDARYATLAPSAHTYRIVGEIIDTLSEGGFDIFNSLAWQHHAYRSSGLGALEWTNDHFQDQHLQELVSSQEAWQDFDNGKNAANTTLLQEAAYKMTDYEQNTIIVPTWGKLRAITPVNNEVTNTFTTLAENIMKPNGDRFTIAVPGGDLSDTADRWKWIDDGVADSPNGIIGAWKAAGKTRQRALVSGNLRADSERFTQVPAWLRATVGVFPNERGGMQVNDDLDVP